MPAVTTERAPERLEAGQILREVGGLVLSASGTAGVITCTFLASPLAAGALCSAAGAAVGLWLVRERNR